MSNQIYCDAAKNKVSKIVNRFGRNKTYDNGGYRIGILAVGIAEAIYVNQKCPDQFAAECWSVLKTVEVAVELDLKSITIINDCICGFKASTKKGYIGAKYLWIAKNIAEENDIEVQFEDCTSDENLADPISRNDTQSIGIKFYENEEEVTA